MFLFLVPWFFAFKKRTRTTSDKPWAPRFSWLVWSLFRHHVASGSLRPWCCSATWTIIAMGPWVDGYYRIWHEGKVWEDIGDTMNIGDTMGLTCRNTVLCLFCWILTWQINMVEPCGTRVLRNTETHKGNLGVIRCPQLMLWVTSQAT